MAQTVNVFTDTTKTALSSSKSSSSHNTETKHAIASRTAKNGYKNEEFVTEKFRNWKNDKEAQHWLKIMGYDLNKITSIDSYRFSSKNYKADVIVELVIDIEIKVKDEKQKEMLKHCIEKIQVKLVSGKKSSSSGQIERGDIDRNYYTKWHLENYPVAYQVLRYFTGKDAPYKSKTQKNNRMYVNEFSEDEQKELYSFLMDNMVMIISDIIRGRGRFAAEWILVVQRDDDNIRTKIVSINEAINHYVGDHSVEFTNRGGIRIGKIHLQRKGSDNGDSSPTDLQFKANPLELFDIPE